MSQSVIFSVGSVIFGLTVWGAVMASGIWLGGGAASEDDAGRRTLFTELGPDDGGGGSVRRTTP